MKTKKLVLILIGIGVGILSILTYGILEEEKKIISLKVLNSGFERGLDKPYSWSEDARGGWSIDKEDPYIGDRCMQATEGWSWFSQKVPVEPEKFYRLKARLKSDIKDRENVFLTLECLNKDDEVIKREWGARSATSLWHLKESSIFTPKDTKMIKIRLAKRQGEGSVWFDEVELEKTSSSLLSNPGFEMGLDKPDSWVEDAEGGWSIDKEDPYIGDRCIQATKGWSSLWQKVPVEPEKFYRLKARLKSDIKDRENALLALICLDKNGKEIEKEDGVRTATSSWHLKENSIFTPKGTKTIKIRLAKRQGGGSVWFDEVEFKKFPLYMRIKFLRGIAEDKPFFIFYFLIYALLLFFLLRIVFKK